MSAHPTQDHPMRVAVQGSQFPGSNGAGTCAELASVLEKPTEIAGEEGLERAREAELGDRLGETRSLSQ